MCSFFFIKFRNRKFEIVTKLSKNLKISRTIFTLHLEESEDQRYITLLKRGYSDGCHGSMKGTIGSITLPPPNKTWYNFWHFLASLLAFWNFFSGVLRNQFFSGCVANSGLRCAFWLFLCPIAVLRSLVFSNFLGVLWYFYKR